MERLYYQIPYVKSFEGTVVSCIEGKGGFYKVVLDRTAFYPEGGGQPFDTGFLGGVRVEEVHEKEGEVVHYLREPLTKGAKVRGEIDWERRFDHMQLHSGEHLVSGLIHSHFGFDNVGFHMGSEEVTIDINGVLEREQLMAIEKEANQMIYQNLPVKESYPSEEELHKLEYRSKKELKGQVRIITIPGGDVCACCGTHVERTGEIGIIKLLSMIHYKGGVRISLLCGGKALEDYERKQRQVILISNLLSAKPMLIAEAVEKMKHENGQKDYRLGQLYQQLFRMEAERFPESDQPMILFKEDLTPVLLRQLCTLLAEGRKGSFVLVCSGDEENGYQYALGSAGRDMRALSRELNQSLDGRGGGSAPMAQGTFKASQAQIRRIVSMKAATTEAAGSKSAKTEAIATAITTAESER